MAEQFWNAEELKVAKDWLFNFVKSCFRSLFHFAKTEVDSLFNGKRITSKFNGFIIFSASEIKELTTGKLLVITSRKVGLAHQRNLLRRQLKYIFYSRKQYFLKTKTIIICSKKTTDLSFEQLSMCLEIHFQKMIGHLNRQQN